MLLLGRSAAAAAAAGAVAQLSGSGGGHEREASSVAKKPRDWVVAMATSVGVACGRGYHLSAIVCAIGT